MKRWEHSTDQLADMFSGWAKRHESELRELCATTGKSLEEWVALAHRKSYRRPQMRVLETLHVILLAQRWIKSVHWLTEQIKAEIAEQTSRKRPRKRPVPVFGSVGASYVGIFCLTNAATCIEELRHRLAEIQRADELNKLRHNTNRNAKNLVCSEWLRRRNDFPSAEKAAKNLACWLENQGLRYEYRTIADWIRAEAKKRNIQLR